MSTQDCRIDNEKDFYNAAYKKIKDLLIFYTMKFKA
jgi:hypothetical protein